MATTTEVFKKLAQQLIDNASGTVYTVPAATQAIIKHIVITNNTGSTVTISVWIGTADDTHIILPGVDLAAGEWCEFDGSIVMEAAETLKANASTNNVCGIRVDGLELS